ncbi:MAG: sugar transferase [Ruthenibacterium sp.]
MRHKNQAEYSFVSALADACLIMAAYFISVWLRIMVFTDKPESFEVVLAPKSLLAAAVSAGIMVVLYGVLGLYGTARHGGSRREFYYLACVNGFGVLIIGTALYVFRLENFSRMVLVYFFVLSCAFIYAKRAVLRYIWLRARARGHGRCTVALIGAGELAVRYYKNVVCDAHYGYTFSGYYAQEQTDVLPQYKGTFAHLRGALAAGGVDEVVIAMQQADEEAIGMLVSACGRFGVKVSVIPPYNDFIPSTPQVEPQGGLKLMTVRSAPDKGFVWRAVKRTMDITISALGLVILSPIMLCAAIAVKASSPGAAIFQQQRAGKNGVPFAMYKFRSMYSDAEERLAELQDKNESDGPTFKIANDPRITPVGHFLRKTSIDELPQLFNILRGDMSIVGPRPPLLREVAQYSDWDWGRLTVKPGLTCFWQISGRSDISFAQWMQLDLKYVEEQSFWTDVKIIFQTVWVVLCGKGAY